MKVQFPPAAAVWLAPGPMTNWLVSGAGSRNAARAIAKSTNVHRVTVTAPTWRETRRLADTLAPMGKPATPGKPGAATAPTAPTTPHHQTHQPTHKIWAIAADPRRLPFAPHTFTQVLLGQELFDNNNQPILQQISQILAPGGRLSMSVILRDDSVPWVGKLARIVQQLAPKAMQPQLYDAEPHLEAIGRFARIEHRSFRLWVPCDRKALLNLVRNQPEIAAAPENDRKTVLDAATALYDSSAKAPEPLLLPYQIACWRAIVDDSELTQPISTDAIPIHLSSPAFQPHTP